MQAPDERDCKQGKDSERNYGREGKSRSMQSKQAGERRCPESPGRVAAEGPTGSLSLLFQDLRPSQLPPNKDTLSHTHTHTQRKVPIVSVQEAFCLKLITG